ncbi:MAG: hypothetical protein RSH24_17500, partial [Flavobacterium sp.]
NMHNFFSNRTKIQKNNKQHPLLSNTLILKTIILKKRQSTNGKIIQRGNKLSREGINCPKKGTKYPFV